jgi:pSer/pThr/pTyr-binding forkhead associated (FHA) protein
MDVALVMFKADGTRRDFAVTKDRMVIGRTSHCDLRIPLSSVSRQHCELVVEGNSVRLRDLGSSNGTYHNSIRVQEADLQPGDEIVIGPVVFTVVINGQPSKIEPVRSVVGDVGRGDETGVEAKSPPEEVAAEPEILATIEDDDDELPVEIEPEEVSPTVDLDDPIAALQAMADSEDDELPMLADDDEDEEEKPKNPPPPRKR